MLFNTEILNALLTYSYQLFAIPEYKYLNYSDPAHPLKYYQINSQPYIFALMTPHTEFKKIVLPFAESSLLRNSVVLNKNKNGTLYKKFVARPRFATTMGEI